MQQGGVELLVRNASIFDIQRVERHRIEGATHIPMREVPARVGELEPAREVVAICHHGGRSQQVAMFLEKNGFAKIHNLQGGLDAWSRTVDPAVPVY